MAEEEKLSRDVIKPEVIKKLQSFAEPNEQITEETHLQKDLDLGPSFRFALALPFTKISKRYGGYVVRGKETKKLDLVKKAIDLVHKKANRKK